MAENQSTGVPVTSADIPKLDSSELNYGAELKDLPGVPWQGSTVELAPVPLPNTSTANADPFASLYNGFDKNFYKRAQTSDYMKMGAPTPFNAEATMFDKFESTNHGIFSSWFSDYAEKGFVPWRDNDDIYNQDTNLLKELYRSTKWSAPLFGEGFVSGLRTFPDLIAGLFDGDWETLFQTDDKLAQEWGRAVRMGGSTAGGVSSFLTNFEVSAANMVGMVSELLIEDALIGALTVGSGGATAPLVAAEAGKNAAVFAKIWNGFKNINKVVDIFKEANNARRFYEVSMGGAKAFGKKAFNFLNPLENTLGGFGKAGFIKDLYRGEEYVTAGGAFKTSLQGFGAFYRDLREVNFALTEAKLEGGFNYLERKTQMTDDYIAKNGYAPQGEEAYNIEQNARASGDFVTKANMPVIYFSNRLGFGNLFKGYAPLNKLMAEASAGNSLFKNIRFNSAKKLFEKGTDYSVKNFYRHSLGSSLNYFKANFMEGIQENLQDVVNGAATDYYDKRFNNPSYGGNLVMIGDIASQIGISGQGVETFLSGFLMGSVPGAGMKAASGIQNLTYRLTNKEGYKEFKTKREEQINKYVTQLNEVYKDPTKYLNPELMNAARQGELTKFLAQSVKNGNQKEFYDIKDQAVYEHLSTMIRSGKADIFRERLQEFKQLKPEEFENALGYKVEDVENFKQNIDQQLGKLDQIEKLYRVAEDKFKNPVNLAAFKRDSKEFDKAAQQWMAFENAKHQAVFANYSFMRNAERMRDLLGQMKKETLIAESTSFTDFSILTDPKLLVKEIGILTKEIQSLSGQTDAESKKILKDKVNKRKALEVWNGVMNSAQLEKNPVAAMNKFLQTAPVSIKRGLAEAGQEQFMFDPNAPQELKAPMFPIDYPSADNTAYDNWRRAAKFAFENLVTTEAGVNKDAVYRDAVDRVFDLIMDYHTLGRESKGLNEMVNILADPKNFLKLYDGHYKVIQDIVRRRAQKLTDAIINALTVADKNSLVNRLAMDNYVEDPEEAGVYYTITDLKRVEPGSADAQKIEEIIKEYNEATAQPAQPAAQPAQPQAQPTPTPAAAGPQVQPTAATMTPTTPFGTPAGPAVVTQVSQPSASITETEKALSKEREAVINLINDKYGTAYGISSIGLLDNNEFDIVEGFTTIQKGIKVTREEQEEFVNLDPKDPNQKKEFFKKVAERRLKEIDAELAALKGTPTAAPTKADTSKELADKLLAEIEEIESLEDIVKYEPYIAKGTPEYDQLVQADVNRLSKAITDKIDSLSGVSNLDESDPAFIEAFNNAMDATANQINPNVTEEQVKAIFKTNFEPVISKLKDKAARAKFVAMIKQERENIISTINSNKRAKDINALKIAVNAIFRNNVFLSDISAAAELLFESIVSSDETVKEQVLNYYIAELDKKLKAKIEGLMEATGSVENDEVAKKYIAHLSSYREKILTSLDRYKQQAEEIKEKTEGITLAVDIDEDYENSTHASILTVKAFENRPATQAQIAALNNLITSGVLLADEVDTGSLSIHDGSFLINQGVTRIFTIGINKGINIYLKTGKTETLEKELTDYWKAEKGATFSEVAERVKKTVADIKAGEQTVTGILAKLNIPETAEITEDQFKLLRAFRNAVYNIQSEANILSTLDELKTKQDAYVAKGVAPSSLEELIEIDSINVIKKYLASEKGTKMDLGPFYDDLLEVVEKVQETKDVKDSEKLIKELVKKYSTPAKSADAANLIRAFIGNVLETQGLLSGQIEVGEELTDEEILRILNGEKRNLTPSQMRQVEAYEKDLIESTKSKLSSAPGYQEVMIQYTPEKLGMPTPETGVTGRLAISALRQKSAEDLRTVADLMAEYKASNKKINIRTALEIISNSDHATPAERELASLLYNIVGEKDTLDIDNALDSAGAYDPESGRISINLEAIGYKADYPSNPIETVILHELLHQKTEDALEDPNSDFKKAIRSLYTSVAQNPDSAGFYAFDPSLSADEQLREFITEAFTNPAFQYMLAQTPYSKSGKSVWQRFLDAVVKMLNAVGIDVEGSALNEVINQTTELLKFDYAENMLKKVTKANTMNELNELEVELSKEGGVLSPNVSESMLSAIRRKKKTLQAKDVAEQLKGMKTISIDSKTYFYKTVDGKPVLYNRTSPRKLTKVRKADTLAKFKEALAKLEKEEKGETGTEQGGEFKADSTTPPAKAGKDPSAFDASTIDPNNTITAVNTNALRSYAFDLDFNNEETDFFKNYYFKIRNIINALSLKSSDDLKDVHITLDMDSASLRWDDSATRPEWVSATKGVIGYLSDGNGNPLVFNSKGEIVATMDRNNMEDNRGLRNGENQIIYFTTFTKASNTAAAKMLTPESKAELFAARDKAMAGTPQVARLVRITPGQVTTKRLVKPSKGDQVNTKNEDFFRQLSQPNITFEFGPKGTLLAIVKTSDGAVNKFGLYPPETRNVVWNNNGVTRSLFDHMINVMQTLHDMQNRGEDIEELKNQFAAFARDMWLTGENYKLQIPKNLERIRIRETKEGGLVPLQIFTIKNGVAVINIENVDKARKFMNNLPINISKAWFTGAAKFEFPRIVTVNGQKIVRFVGMDYSDFLFKQIGLSSNVTEIPSVEELKRYNSLIVFTNPTDLAAEATPTAVTEQQLLEDPNAVKKNVDESIKQSQDKGVRDEAEREAMKKRKRFKAPSYDQIFEKTCK